MIDSIEIILISPFRHAFFLEACSFYANKFAAGKAIIIDRYSSRLNLGINFKQYQVLVVSPTSNSGIAPL
jgi:hypothetical protein